MTAANNWLLVYLNGFLDKRSPCALSEVHVVRNNTSIRFMESI